MPQPDSTRKRPAPPDEILLPAWIEAVNTARRGVGRNETPRDQLTAVVPGLADVEQTLALLAVGTCTRTTTKLLAAGVRPGAAAEALRVAASLDCPRPYKRAFRMLASVSGVLDEWGKPATCAGPPQADPRVAELWARHSPTGSDIMTYDGTPLVHAVVRFGGDNEYGIAPLDADLIAAVCATASDPGTKDDTGATPLATMAKETWMGGSEDLCRCYQQLAHAAPHTVDEPDLRGRTPLHHAVGALTDLDINVVALLPLWPDPHHQDDRGMTPIQLLREIRQGLRRRYRGRRPPDELDGAIRALKRYEALYASATRSTRALAALIRDSCSVESEGVVRAIDHTSAGDTANARE